MRDTEDCSPDLTGKMHIVPLNRAHHAGLGVDTGKLNRYTQTLNTVFVNVVEFFYANRHYPLVFVSDADKGFIPCAVTGLEQGQNLFVGADGSWVEGVYVPAQARMYPVYVSSANTDEDKRIILVDEDALTKSADPFFTNNSTPTEKWKRTEKFVSDYISAEKLTREFTGTLESLGLLEPFDAQINPAHTSPRRLTGLYRVSEERLNNLPAKDIKSLMKGGELSRIYAHLISLENFSGLLDRSVDASTQHQQQ